MKRHKHMYIYLIFICAFFIRLINLNQSLWLDEATVAKVVQSIPLHLIPLRFSPGDFHPPLYYMFMSIWGGLFGTSEIALRAPSIIFSLIAGWFVFKIASLIKDKKTGVWAALFFLFNPLIIYYSQEARMYMMATMFLSMAFYYFLISIREMKVPNIKFKSIVLFNVFCALAMLTFYGSAFFIGGMIISDLRGRGFWQYVRMPVYLSVGLFISSLLLSPLLFQQLQNAKMGLAEVKNWSLVLGKAEIKNCAMIFVKFTAGRISWYPKWSYYLVVGGWSIVVGFFVFLGMKKNKLLTFIFFFPLCVGLVVSFFAPMMMYFRFLYLIPVMSVLLAIAPSSKISNLKYVVITLFLIFSFTYLCNPAYHREDWKTLVQHIDIKQPVYMILPSSDPVNYYNSNISLFELRDIEKKMLIPEQIQLIPYVEEIYGYDHISTLKKKGCSQESRSEYRGPLFLEKWKCPPSFIGHAYVSPI